MILPLTITGNDTDWRTAFNKLESRIVHWSQQRIDGYNISSAALGDGLYYSATTALGSDPNTTVPPKITNALADTSRPSYISINRDTGDADVEYIDIIGEADIYLRAFSSTRAAAKIRVGTADITAGANIIPLATNTYDIGTTSLAVKEIYTRIIDTDGVQTLTIQRNNVTQLTLDGTTIDAAKQVRSTLNDGSYNYIGPVGGDAYYAGGTRSTDGTGRSVILQGGPALGTNGKGGAAKVYGATGTSGGAGGDIEVYPGQPNGGGAPGVVKICSVATDQLQFFAGGAASQQTLTGSRGGNAALANLNPL